MPEPLNLSRMKKSLFVERFAPPGDLAWIEESCRNPAGFWLTVRQAQDTALPWPVKSTPFEKYDFYHDIVVRNRNNPAPAFCWHDPVLEWQQVSYSELGTRAAALEAKWLRQGFGPGQKVCIVLPLGVDYAVSLLAAFKIGVIISLLPPQGDLFLQNRLEALAPDHIVTAERYISLLGSWRECAVLSEFSPQGSTATNPEHSYTYSSGQMAALCFDPGSATSHRPIELTADSAYLTPLRDGMLALGLQAGQILTAPDFDFLETQPGMLLSVMLNGGTYLHLEGDDVVAHPELLNAYPITTIGICRRIREALLANPLTLIKTWDYWFRNLLEARDITRWQLFSDTLGLEDIYNGNMNYEAVFGGCSLFSIKRRGQATFDVLPSAGVRWRLADVGNRELDSTGGFGLYSATPPGRVDDHQAVTPSIIARSDRELLFVGSRTVGNAADTHPRTEILEVVAGIGHCSCCSLVELPAVEPAGDSRLALLVFTAGETGADSKALEKEIRTAIERKLGSDFIPAQIHFFPVYARREADGAIDHLWCRDQFLTGGLVRRSQDVIFRCLAQLRIAMFHQ